MEGALIIEGAKLALQFFFLLSNAAGLTEEEKQKLLIDERERFEKNRAVRITTSGGDNSRTSTDNTISYNVIYDIYGEILVGTGFIAEYNLFGDSASAAWHPNLLNLDCKDATFRYNLVTQSNDNTYDNISWGAGADASGVLLADSDSSGDNTNCILQVYGNVFINRTTVIQTAITDSTSKITDIRVFNNTIIDPQDYCFGIWNFDYAAANAGKIYNNTCIFYDRSAGSFTGQTGTGTLGDYWDIDNNHYFTDHAHTVNADWDTNYVTTDPKLAGEEQGSPVDWDGQSGATYFSDITFDDIYPESDSSLIDAGKTLTYDDDFLSTGTDFSVLPDTQTFTLLDQDMRGTGWEIGAAVYDSAPATGDPLTITPYTGATGALTITPDAGGAITITY